MPKESVPSPLTTLRHVALLAAGTTGDGKVGVVSAAAVLQRSGVPSDKEGNGILSLSTRKLQM